MPRYEPLPQSEAEAVNQPQVPRYQQMNVEAGAAPPTTSTRPAASRRPSYACQPIFEKYLPALSEAIGPYKPSRQALTGYLSGFLFALGWWMFIDGAVYNSHKYDPTKNMNMLSFEDWLPGIFSTLALIVVNMIDRESLSAEDDQYDGTNVAVKARACAFTGITIAMSSLGGALAILVVKYIIPGVTGEGQYLGQAIAAQSFLIFFGSMVLWFGRNSADEGNISL